METEWKATVRNVNRALKGIDAFEWEGDHLAEAVNRLRELLEDSWRRRWCIDKDLLVW
jgi:hypothetical protein